MIGPAQEWFASKGWTPLDFQREVWRAYLDGESGLIHAATGTGKTLAAWWGPLLEYLEESGLSERAQLVRHSESAERPEDLLLGGLTSSTRERSPLASIRMTRSEQRMQQLHARLNRLPRPRAPRAGGRDEAAPLRVLWITPLRALAADTAEALGAPLRDLDIPWTLETRTGDTDAPQRA